MVQKFIAAGFEVMVETGAGAGASFSDDVFSEAGATIAKDTKTVWSADVIIKVRPPEYNKELGRHEVELMKKGANLISFIWPAQNKELLLQLAKKKATAMAMDSIPRISRAQETGCPEFDG